MFSHKLNRRSLFGAVAGLAAASGGFRIVGAQEWATPAAIEPKDVYTFMVLGLDTRPDGQELNTDVMMVSRVNLVDNTVRSISFPRDLYVDIPGVGLDKINQAFKAAATNGQEDWMLGMSATRATLEHNFGLTIDATLSITFQGVERIVDALGGITFHNPYDLADDNYPTMDYGTTQIFFPAGEQEITGEQALQLMRTRHQDGDDGRVMRQQLILTELLAEAQDPANLTRLPELVAETRDAVITDIPTAVQTQLITSVPNIPQENVVWGSITHLLWGDVVANGMWVYQGDWSVLPGYVQGFLNGEI